MKINSRRVVQQFARLGVIGALALSATGCIELAVGSAVMGGFAATDRRTFGAQTEDKAIVLKGEGRLAQLFGKSAHINVTSFNRRALLTGEVADDNARQVAEREIRAIDGVVHVVNEIQIAGLSDLGSRSNDALITTKVKASFVDTETLSANSFKVVTEAGVVFLMGRVTQREGALAADVASRTGGVRKVVKVFEYISEQELQDMRKSREQSDNRNS